MELLVLGGAQIEKYNTNNYKYYCSMSKVQKLKANTIILIISYIILCMCVSMTSTISFTYLYFNLTVLHTCSISYQNAGSTAENIPD